MRTAKYWIAKLGMKPHPEGGYFKETYRSDEIIVKDALHTRFGADRSVSTSVYFLLEGDQRSKLHRIKSDEMWHFYDGESLVIYSFDEQGKLIEDKLGLDAEEGESPQALIKAGRWFGAKLAKPDTYCLAGCTVAPGFSFDDFEMGDKEILLSEFPGHRTVIEQLT